jgi:GH15 family glucan-1,4-alpha-glucosidase
MSTPIEDYGLIGDTHTAALVGRDGSIDWLCLPRFDSHACFAALLGDAGQGRWLLAPVGGARAVRRRYLPDTLMLESEYDTDGGTVRVLDAMPVRDSGPPNIVRRVEGVRGRVRMRSELVPRFDYGHIEPMLRFDGRRVVALAGPDQMTLDADVAHTGHDERAVAEFDVDAGRHVDFRLGWSLSRQAPAEGLDVGTALEATQSWWRDWARRCSYDGPYRGPVTRSLITLKALVYAPSGGIVAAPTTSLPEQLHGPRNWDYRYCWIRDATFTLLALLHAGYVSEAKAWREWLVRAVAGHPRQMQIMYGVDGERRLTEVELDWLPGYAGSAPVREGNAASGQFQLDVYGELMDALHQARTHDIPPDPHAWTLQRRLMDFLESAWHEPDNGIWEVRGQPRHFTHSKVMAWAAADRAVRAVEHFDLDGPADRWRRMREDIHDEVCERGYDPSLGSFTQYYGSKQLDASLLLMAPVGFLPATDKRIEGTVEAIEKSLCHKGFVRRYDTDADNVDGLPGGEAAFLPCTFWLADNHILAGRADKGRTVFDRLLDLRTDLGLLSEEYDPDHRRLLGNFPQALSHLALVNTALDLAGPHGPTQGRASQ